jgi:hypothetical protein
MSGIVGDGTVSTCKHLMRVRELKHCVFCHRDQLQQENKQFHKALKIIRDGKIPQAMSPALFAEVILRDPSPTSLSQED